MSRPLCWPWLPLLPPLPVCMLPPPSTMPSSSLPSHVGRTPLPSLASALGRPLSMTRTPKPRPLQQLSPARTSQTQTPGLTVLPSGSSLPCLPIPLHMPYSLRLCPWCCWHTGLLDATHCAEVTRAEGMPSPRVQVTSNRPRHSCHHPCRPGHPCCHRQAGRRCRVGRSHYSESPTMSPLLPKLEPPSDIPRSLPPRPYAPMQLMLAALSKSLA
jgi:hypothetical protein